MSDVAVIADGFKYFIVVKLLQLLKILLPIDVTLLGISIDVNPVPAKHLMFNELTVLVFKKFTVANEDFKKKQSLPIVVTAVPTSTRVKLNPDGTEYDAAVKVVSVDVDVVEFE